MDMPILDEVFVMGAGYPQLLFGVGLSYPNGHLLNRLHC